MENIQTLSINVFYITSLARLHPLGTPILHLASDETFAFQHRGKTMPLSTSLNIIVSCSFMFEEKQAPIYWEPPVTVLESYGGNCLNREQL